RHAEIEGVGRSGDTRKGGAGGFAVGAAVTVAHDELVVLAGSERSGRVQRDEVGAINIGDRGGGEDAGCSVFKPDLRRGTGEIEIPAVETEGAARVDLRAGQIERLPGIGAVEPDMAAGGAVALHEECVESP